MCDKEEIQILDPKSALIGEKLGYLAALLRAVHNSSSILNSSTADFYMKDARKIVGEISKLLGIEEETE
jgi:hypothetical protein